MIVYAAIVPHSPLLIPHIGKEHRSALSDTLRAYTTIEERLYLLGIETIVMISPHAHRYPNASAALIADQYHGTMKSFGDHQTNMTLPHDPILLDRLREHLVANPSTPFTLAATEELDYGFTVPLILLTEHMKHVSLLPLSPSFLNGQAQMDFGSVMKEPLHESATRIAVIASADLSHTLSETSPAGKNVEGPAFDALVRSKLLTMDASSLLSMDEEAIVAAGQCGYEPIMILLGVLQHMNVKPIELSYEAPFGVGYLTMGFDIA